MLLLNTGDYKDLTECHKINTQCIGVLSPVKVASAAVTYLEAWHMRWNCMSYTSRVKTKAVVCRRVQDPIINCWASGKF